MGGVEGGGGSYLRESGREKKNEPTYQLLGEIHFPQNNIREPTLKTAFSFSFFLPLLFGCSPFISPSLKLLEWRDSILLIVTVKNGMTEQIMREKKREILQAVEAILQGPDNYAVNLKKSTGCSQVGQVVKHVGRS